MPPLKVAQLGGRASRAIALVPDAETRAALASFLGLEALRKFRLEATLRPLGKSDWELTGHLGATVVQKCAVTLDPVSTRIDEQIHRQFIADLPEPDGLEIEMPEDDTIEALGSVIDISGLAVEALALAIPAFVRAPGAELSGTGTVATAPEGAEPLSDTSRKPFAALAALRERLSTDSPPDPEPKD
ncbi:MAG: DUF177 domain-containing protein [Rhodobacteraceae bacterium]|nr:MAG: DUF177 domain-containing protein [Paracoccaceae bacterium]